MGPRLLFRRRHSYIPTLPDRIARPHLLRSEDPSRAFSLLCYFMLLRHCCVVFNPASEFRTSAGLCSAVSLFLSLPLFRDQAGVLDCMSSRSVSKTQGASPTFFFFFCVCLYSRSGATVAF
ncbi:hypothetical protein BR93DRAFT_981900 [Coniochaeta sp. PMI_546]|nr:hypothetical protein BR93DRAFT_981900 [Coniochaeta sp. PMI_546]